MTDEVEDGPHVAERNFTGPAQACERSSFQQSNLALAGIPKDFGSYRNWWLSKWLSKTSLVRAHPSLTLDFVSEPSGIRTRDPVIKSHMLYRLS